MKARGTATNSALAFGGDVASKAGALLVVILAARFFSVDEFALIATALAIAGVLVSLLDLGAATLLTRDGASSAAARGVLFRGLLQARAPLSVAVLIAAPLVGIWLGGPLIALAVATFAVCSALALSVLGVYRSCRDLRPEAIQRVAAAILATGSVILCGLVVPRADVLLAALALATLVTLLPLVVRLPRVADLSDSIAPLSVLRRAAPIGLMALATVAYYRSGTIVLALLGDTEETAVFSVAASLAFGLLMIPNAITTALLPRLAVEQSLGSLVECTRRALVWTLAIAIVVASTAAAVSPMLLPRLVGPQYSTASYPFILLCVGIPIIATSSVIGTAVLALGRLRALGVQVGCTLLLNLVALAAFAPRFESVGAALATVICELAGLVVLLIIGRRLLPGLLSIRTTPWVAGAHHGSAARGPERAVRA